MTPRKPSITQDRRPRQPLSFICILSIAFTLLTQISKILFVAINDPLIAVRNDYGLETSLEAAAQLRSNDMQHHRWVSPPHASLMDPLKSMIIALMAPSNLCNNLVGIPMVKTAQGASLTSKRAMIFSSFVINHSNYRDNCKDLQEISLLFGVLYPRSDLQNLLSDHLCAAVAFLLLLWVGLGIPEEACNISNSPWIPLIKYFKHLFSTNLIPNWWRGAVILLAIHPTSCPSLRNFHKATDSFQVLGKILFHYKYPSNVPTSVHTNSNHLLLLAPKILMQNTNTSQSTTKNGTPLHASPCPTDVSQLEQRTLSNSPRVSHPDQHQPTPPFPLPKYKMAVQRGLSHHSHLVPSSSSSPAHDQSREEGIFPQEGHSNHNSPIPPLDDDLCLDVFEHSCLVAKIWGQNLPIAAIKNKTKADWKEVRGEVDYIDLGNHWILLKFSTDDDRHYVWNERPWFVQGLNLVIQPWQPFFDPYSAKITHIDQWVKIPRLPLEYWGFSYLTSILSEIGTLIRLDDYTRLRLRGKFARACINVDITKPLRSCIELSYRGKSAKFAVIYEGLHDICALCGQKSHELDDCPSLQNNNNIEIIVEHFAANSVHDVPSSSSLDPSPDSEENWIKVTPKRRTKMDFLNAKINSGKGIKTGHVSFRGNSDNLFSEGKGGGSKVAAASPTMVAKPLDSLEGEPRDGMNPPLVIGGVPDGYSPIKGPTDGVIALVPNRNYVSPISPVGGAHSDDDIDHNSPLSSPSLPSDLGEDEGDFMDALGMRPEVSSESSKKRKLVEAGMEVSSFGLGGGSP